MCSYGRLTEVSENCVRVLPLDGLDGRNILRCTLSSILLDDDVDCDAIRALDSLNVLGITEGLVQRVLDVFPGETLTCPNTSLWTGHGFLCMFP
jgi:hypothetical protein